MFEIKACRGCLNTDCRLEKISQAFRRVLPSLTGLEIKEADGYPQYLCVECHTQVRKALAFRRKFRRAGYMLQEIINAKKQVCIKEIKKIDRGKSNLTSSLITAICCIDIDIRPENCEEVEVEEKEPEEVCNLEEVDAEVDREDSLEDNEEELQNIDLNDVFKGLKENHVEEESDKEQEKKEVEQKKKKVKSNLNKPTVYKAFQHAEISYVPEEKQRANFELRKNLEPFKSAEFKCSLCVTVFDQYKTMFYHMKDEHQSMVDGRGCNICKLAFSTEEELLVHRAHTHWYEYRSALCNCTHYTLEQHVACYESQMEEKHGSSDPRDMEIYLSFRRAPLRQEEMANSLVCADPKYQCSVCSMGFKEVKPFTAHKKNHMLKKFNFICDVCGVCLQTKWWVCTHLKNSHMYSYTCKHCDLVFMNKSLAWYHITRECSVCHLYKNRSGSSNAKCTLCGKIYKARSHLLKHFSLNHYEELFVHHCTTCGVAFQYLHELVPHQLSKHNYIRISDRSMGSEQFSCATCSLRLLNQRALETHLVKFAHQGARDVPLACASCKLLFENEDEMNSHRDNVCTTTRYPQKCTYCEHVLCNKDEYESHYRTEHKGLYCRPASPSARSAAHAMCELCGMTFTAAQLRSHTVHAHSAEPWPYTCALCRQPRALPSAGRLLAHLLASHTNRPYHCARCPARFRGRVECRDHILKKHAPVRPYTCGECARTFSHLDYLHEHAVDAHGAAPNKAAKSLSLPNKFKGFKIAVYPDMKIDVSRVDASILKDVQVYLCDYMDENLQLLHDNAEHFIFEPSKDKVKRSRRKKGSPKDDTPKKEATINKGRKRRINKNCRRKKSGKGGPKKKRRKTKEVISCEETEDVAKEQDFSRLGDSVLDEAGNEYKIIMQNGVEHVLVAGALYKLEIT